MKETVRVDVTHEAPEDGDVYLLCSDGLSGMINDDEIAEYLGAKTDLDTQCRVLIDAANKNGGTDNITVILVRYEED